MVLHGREAGPIMLAGDIKRPRELPGGHVAGADVARLSSLHYVVQSLHRLLDRRVRIVAMDLIEVDIIDAKSTQRIIDLCKDRPPRQALTVGAGSHARPDLGGD